MLKLSRMGALVMPPLPAFYNHPRTIDDIVDYTVAGCSTNSVWRSVGLRDGWARWASGRTNVRGQTPSRVSLVFEI